MLFLG